MAELEMRRIGTEIAQRWPTITGVAIAHRVGRVEIGEASVAVAISAPHRREALAACAHGIDRLKAALPVWKREVFADGSEWRENAAEEDPNEGR
jgi:molybdopterin synthase catalytic subunit